jgi:hypothetical protein
VVFRAKLNFSPAQLDDGLRVREVCLRVREVHPRVRDIRPRVRDAGLRAPDLSLHDQYVRFRELVDGPRERAVRLSARDEPLTG